MAVNEQTFRLGGSSRYASAFAEAEISEEIRIIPDPDVAGGYLFAIASGAVVGAITSRHWLAKELSMGRRLLHATVNCVNASATPAITVRVATGEDGDTFSLPPRIPRVYSVGVVGESFRQEAISRTAVGESVRLIHITDNEHDPRAIVVLNQQSEAIGWLPRDGWLTAALLDEGKAYRASVSEIHAPRGPRRYRGVVLAVVLE